MATETNKTVKTIVEEVLGIRTVKDLWTANYTPVLPLSLQEFTLGAVMPAVFYMFRCGKRRGRGKFNEVFGRKLPRPVGEVVTDKASEKIGSPTIESVTDKLLSNTAWFEGIHDVAERNILGDALLAFCLENRGHKLGRTEQVQRVLPTHYFSSWIDLPESVAHLRFVPEMLVALLVDQKKGDTIKLDGERSRFSLISRTADIDSNDLIKPFAQGLAIEGFSNDLHADRFDEHVLVGIDQLLTIRCAELCGEGPVKLRGKDEQEFIANRRPLAGRAAGIMREDLHVFLRAYGNHLPRLSLLPMLESAIALGLTNILLSTCKLLFSWEETGRIPLKNSQTPWELFVDCSMSADHELRRVAEESMDDLLRRYDRVPVIMMCLRVLDAEARYESEIDNADDLRKNPDGSDWINLLGDLFHGRHDESQNVHRNARKLCRRLAEELERQDEGTHVCGILKSDQVNPVWRLADALITLMTRNNQNKNYNKALDSCLMLNQPHGVARKRQISNRGVGPGGRRTSDARSVALSNTMLDFLVHRYLRKSAKGRKPTSLSFQEFLRVLRTQYGLYVDQSPGGMSIPSEILHRNRRFLERRLRDLGLLAGVNDAESMKMLKPRFVAEAESDEA